jgi:type IV pilus assembly protein PilW
MSNQSGISMVEVLISLLVSSFLILGVTQVYLDNKENNLFQQSQAGNLESARFSILVLEQTLSKTGYRRMPDQPLETSFPATTTSDCGVLSAGQVAKKVSDTAFCIRYQPAFTGAKDCAGNNIAGIPSEPYTTAPPVTEYYSLVDLAPSDADNSMQLTCNNTVITSNIAAVRFAYGVNNNSEKTVTKYTNSPATGENIRAIQFSIMAASPAEITQAASSTAYTHWFGAPPADKKLYTMLSTSTSMRNLTK